MANPQQIGSFVARMKVLPEAGATRRSHDAQLMAFLLLIAILQWPVLGRWPSMIATLVMAVTGILWALPEARPLGVLLFGAPVVNWICHPFGVHGAAFFALLPLVAALVVPWWRDIGRSLRRLPHVLIWAAGGFFLWMFFSFLVGPRTDWALLKLFAFFGRCVLGTFATAVFLVRRRTATDGFWVFAVAIVAFHFACYSEYFPLSQFNLGIWKTNIEVGIDSIGVPRAAGLCLLLIAPAVMEATGNRAFLLILLLMACLGPTFIAADTRQVTGGLLGALIVYVILTPPGRNSHRWIPAVLFAAFLLIIVYGFDAGYSRYSVFFNQDLSLAQKLGRQHGWDAGVVLWSDNPVFGAGLGGYSLYSSQYGRDYPHNIIVELLAETGIIGVVLFVILLVVILRFSLRLRRDPRRREIFAIIIPAWAYAVAVSLVSLDLPLNAEVLFLPLGGILATCMVSPACTQSPCVQKGNRRQGGYCAEICE